MPEPIRERAGGLTSPFQVRTMHEREIDEAIALIYESIHHINTPDYPPEQIEAIFKMYDAETLGSYMVIVVQQQSQLVGVAAYHILYKKCWISAMFTHPDWLRQGVGRALVQEIEARALKQDVIQISVASSLTAVNFYQTLDYEQLNAGKLADNVDCVHFRKRLRSLNVMEQMNDAINWMLFGLGILLVIYLMVKILILYLEETQK